MPGGEVQLVAFGEENMYLNQQPQITFFKIVYRRYTNFCIETVQTNFIYQANFGKKISCELSKLGDLIHKMWLVIELPNIPILYDLTNTVDKKLKFAWTRKIAYALIDYVEIEISGQVISRMWGEWFNVLDELNYTNFNSSMDQYIGNIPELYTLQTTKEGIKSFVLHIPMYFCFCNNSGMALPVLCLEYNTIRFNVKLNDFSSCAIFSPSNYILVQKYYGTGILAEPLVQFSQQGIAWAEFDSIDPSAVDATTMSILNYKLYYRKISDNSFITTTANYFNNLLSNNLLNIIQNGYTKEINYIIFGLKSKSIYIPIPSLDDNPNTIFIENNYIFRNPIEIPLKNIFLLVDYIYLDRDERNKFYNDKHEYIIEQINFTGNINQSSLANRNNIQILNQCKWFVFMGQISYLQNKNVNDFFNYKNTWMRNDNQQIEGDSLILSAYISFNSLAHIEEFPMSYYNLLVPFYNFPMSKNNSGFGVGTFALYPINIQASGSCNISCFNTFDINTLFRRIDVKYDKYIFKTYSVTHNIFRVVHGVSGTLFNSGY
jgi:hypothetical protein